MGFIIFPILSYCFSYDFKKKILNRNEESRQLFMFLILIEVLWCFLFRTLLHYICHIEAFSFLRYVPPIPTLLIILIMKGCGIFVKHILYISWGNHVISGLYSIYMIYHIYWFASRTFSVYLEWKPLGHSESTFWCVFEFASTYFEIFCNCVHWVDCSLIFCCIFIWFW